MCVEVDDVDGAQSVIGLFDGVEGIEAPRGTGAVFPHGIAYPLRAVAGDDEYGGTLFRRQRLEESLHDIFAEALCGSDDGVRVVVDHGRDETVAIPKVVGHGKIGYKC